MKFESTVVREAWRWWTVRDENHLRIEDLGIGLVDSESEEL